MTTSVRESVARRAALVAALMWGGWAWGGEPPGTTPITPHEQTLWDRVVEAQRPVPVTQPFKDWFDSARQQRRLLLSRVRLYLTLYPGGVHRDEAIRWELRTLFELETLQGTGSGERGTGVLGARRGGELGPLVERVTELRRAPPSAAALQEAAYWAILCERAGGGEAAAVESAATGLGPALRQAYLAYIRAYPRSTRVPWLAALVFDDAARGGDRPLMAELVALLTSTFPEHPVTGSVRGKWQRTRAVGEPFEPLLPGLDGKLLDWSAYRGRPVMLVVWAAFDDASRRAVQRIGHVRAGHPQLAVIGVSLDETAEATRTAARELELDWPQCNDGRGWGGEFVRQWGIDRLPLVFVIDAAGRLVASDAGDGWEGPVRGLLRDAVVPAEPGAGAH
ncbi:MAG: TlpA disulfide reductase family protein [Planctomycetota bacterium]